MKVCGVVRAKKGVGDIKGVGEKGWRGEASIKK